MVRHSRRHPATMLASHRRRLLRRPCLFTAVEDHPIFSPLVYRRIVVQPEKIDQSDVSRAVHSSELWISDNAASMHIACSDVEMYSCCPTSPGADIMIIGDKKEHRVSYYGKLDVLFHSTAEF